MDPFVITEREKLKYQEQFKALQPQGGFVTGGQAKGFFLQSQLPPLVLGQIWALADTDSDGKMNINEFSIACKLINLKLRGGEVPKQLPPTLLSSLTAVGNVPTATPTAVDSLSALDPLKNLQTKPAIPPVPVIPAVVPPAVAAVSAPPILPTGQTLPGAVPVLPVQPAPVGVPAAVGLSSVISPTGSVALPDAARASVASTPPHSNVPSRHTSISERAPSIESPQSDWAVKAAQKRKYTQVFNANDRTRSGYLTGVQARGVLVQSKLPQATLAQIWTMSDMDQDGRLSCDEFILAMFLCEKAMTGEKIPVTLPIEWIPPNLRKGKSRQSSVASVTPVAAVSRPGSVSTSRHASISSQGVQDSELVSQTSFEDKRKENYEKGKAELDRRRKLIEDQQRKEREERERKEREEADKREKARLEAERKQQEELERQLQKQRELEQEKEEQRKRELEAKEAAKRELEKQRQQEWEQARIAEMNAQKEREQEKVLKLKAQNSHLNIELSTSNEKIKELSQKICDTRAGVTNVKSVIDGMRSQRDSSMTEMAQLKARIKEQNTKLLQLAQERAKWDAKSKATGADPSEQLNAAFASKQLIIKQLKDKAENIKNEIESKKEDINSNDLQVKEVKEELSSLIEKCDELYKDYDVQRTQVLEMKYSKRTENTTSTSWGVADSSNSWGNTSSEVYGLQQEKDSSGLSAPADIGPAPEGFIKYRAVYEFSARNPEEITFAAGDIVLVPIEQNAEPGWLAGEINGHTGWFPESYVERIADDEYADNNTPIAAVATTTYSDTINENVPIMTEQTTTDLDDSVEYYTAVYPYASAEDGDLNFEAGEMIMVVRKEGDWWTGKVGNRTGMFPSNYVQKVEDGTATATATSAVTPAAVADDVSTFYGEDQQVTPLSNEKSAYDAAKELLKQHLEKEQQQKQLYAAEVVQPNSEETHTNEELDTEVSQINTQSKVQSAEPAESYSRPMSRTSSMTPGMRAKKYEIAQVIAPYEATSTEQLSLTRGQLIMIRKKTDSGWWEGELQAKGRRRQIGWFPATYVKVLQGGRNSGRNTPVSGSRVEMTEQILDKVIALYPYQAQNDDELSFDKNDIINVLGRDEPDWWRGELNGLSGLFPSNYVGPFVSSGKKRATNHNGIKN